MLSYVNFLISSTKKNFGIYCTSFLAIFAVLAMYLANVLIQNTKFNSGLLETASGLVNGYYQNIIVYIFTGISILYFIVFVYKSSAVEGYELILSVKRPSRFQIQIVRFFISFAFLLMISTLQMSFLAIPMKMDVVMENVNKLNWLISIYVGNLITGIIMVAAFSLISSLFNFVASISIGLIPMMAFPIISIMMYETNNPSTDRLDAFEPVSMGAVPRGKYRWEDLQPTVQGKQIVFNNLKLSPIKQKAIVFDNNGELKDGYLDLSQLIKEYKKGLNYGKLAKADGWNAFKSFYNIFNNQENSNNYTYREYKNLTWNQLFNDIKRDECVTFNNTNILMTVLNSTSPTNAVYDHLYFNMDFSPRDTTFVREAIKSAKRQLDTNDAYATRYKEMPFIDQTIFWAFVMENYDYRKGDAFDEKDHDTERRTFFKDFGTKNQVSGFLLAKSLMEENADRYAYEGNEISIFWSSEPNDYNGGPFMYSNYIFSTEEDKNYESDSPWKYVFAAITPLMFGLSLIINVRKDIK